MRAYAVPDSQTAMIGRRLRTLHVIVRNDDGYPVSEVPIEFFTLFIFRRRGIFLRRERKTDERGISRAEFLPTWAGPIVIYCAIGAKRDRFTWFDIEVTPTG